MSSVAATVKVVVAYSDDQNHRFLIKRIWDDSRPKAAIIMLSPSRTADAIAMDMTSMFVVNNCHAQGFGSVNIMNIYSGMDEGFESMPENDKTIVDVCNDMDTIVLAWGKGVAHKKKVVKRIEEVLKLLKPFEKKLVEISDGEDAGFHPLGKTVRLKWQLVPAKLGKPEKPGK
ncbi:MAG: DUF1643 domain-containing protein [Oscillospiraceae bacterium]|nr:DUF1643 domain-containing protein [Oscillospiraceae bacterium]